jgi:hypothetical protein
METDYRKITYQNKECNILKYCSEPESIFEKRLEFIKKLEKRNVDIREIIKLSKLWYNIKYKNCVYPPEIYNRIKFLDKN